MAYTRSAPSEHYRRMLELYRTLHAEGEKTLGLNAQETYPGIHALRHARRIKELIDSTGAKSVLDYGAGKGFQYDLADVEIPGAGRWPGLLDYWDVEEMRCFDPCYEPFNKLPAEKFDGVISTDVLEHCTEEDIPWIVAEIFSFAKSFVFATVACYPAKTTLPNGENAHTTIRPQEWWTAIFAEAARAHPEVRWHLLVETAKEA